MNSVINTPDYDILFVGSGSEVSRALPLQNYNQVAILCDRNTRHHCLPILRKELPADTPVITIAPGEQNKNLNTCQQVLEDLFQYQFGRNSLLINLGGGMVSDLGGFTASIYKRGISFINIPTSLLAMVDATVGGKTGVDFQNLKNGIGVFNNPSGVIIYPGFLKTLPDTECNSGFAEMLKHGLLADEGHLKTLMEAGPGSITRNDRLIHRSVGIKWQIVQQDPFELGLRKVLNFGHTIGHALESHCLHQNKPIPHGHAVALGMIAELWLSATLCGFPHEKAERVNKYLAATYGPILNIEWAIDKLAAFAGNDKKNEGKAMTFSLLENVGKPVSNMEVSTADFAAAIDYLKQQL